MLRESIRTNSIPDPIGSLDLAHSRCILLWMVALLGTALMHPITSWAQYDYLRQHGHPSWLVLEPVEMGSVNLANGNLHLEIPVYASRQRGSLPYSIRLTYDSRIWRILTTSSSVWQSGNVGGSQGGWSLRRPNYAYVTWDVVIGGTCVSGQTNYTWYKYQNFRYAAPGYQDSGATTRFAVYSESNPPCHTPTVTTSGPSIDIPGYWMKLSGSGPAISEILAPDGSKVYGAAGSSGCSSAMIRDANGNCINSTDTLNRNPVTESGLPGQTIYSVLNSEGGTSTITVNYTTVYVKTAFGQSGVTEYQGSFQAIGSIVLADGSQYAFTYDTGTSGSDPTIHYGLLTSMTLPSGGVVNFTHSKFTDVNGKVNLWVTQRQQNVSGGGTWTYTPATCGANCNKVTVTRPGGAPNNEQTVYTFTLNNGAWNTQIDHYKGPVGGTPPFKIENAYHTSIPDPVSGTGSAFIHIMNSTSSEVVPGGTLKRKVEHDHDSFTYTYNGAPLTGTRGNTTEFREYAFGLGAVGGLVRKKVVGYLNDCPSGPYCTRNIVNRVTTAQIQDAGGVKKSEAILTYDSTSLISATGITHHDDTNFGTSMTTRGNGTIIQQWVSGTTYLTTTKTYDMTGQLRQTTDAKGQTTTFSFADNFFNDSDPVSDPPPTYTPSSPTNAFLTQMTLPVTGSISFGHYWGSGNSAYSQDQNGRRSYSHFTDSLDRLDHEHVPQGGTSKCLTRKVYTTSALHNIYRAAGSTPASPTCTTCKKEQLSLDGLGRITTRSVLNDPHPQGQTDTDTAYDTSGRVLSVTNPYRGTPGGSATYSFDYLNRTTSIAKTGGTTYIYHGDTVGSAGGRTTQLCSTVGYPGLSVDEAGKKRQTWTDALGRLVEVDEPDGSGNLNLGTCYSYDVLGNMTQVVQGSETRSYNYDGLSRTTSEATPEGGTTSFYYTTSGGALCAADPKAVCRQTDARSITTTSTYDALSRLTGKTYPNGDGAVSYFYDQTSYNGLTITNGLGRRTGMSDPSGQTAWSFDEQGNVLTERRTIGTVTKTISYTYNIDGSVASITYPGGRLVNYSYNAIGQAVTAADSLNQFANTAYYAPHGALCSFKSGPSITTTYTFNDRLQPTRIHSTTTGAPATPCDAPTVNANILDLSYTWQGAGPDNNDTVRVVTNNLDTGRTQTYTYDTMNRLATAQTQATSGSNCWGQSYGYDRYANLLTATVTKCSAPSLNLTVNTQNRITNTGFTYDASGDMTADGTLTYTWDAEFRLKTAAGVTYTYDGDGKRVKKSSGPLYWFDVQGNLIEETNSTGGAPVQYIYFNGLRVTRQEVLAVKRLFHDHLGSLRVMTFGSGIIRTIDYYPYGGTFLNTGTSEDPFRFAQMYYDTESSLYQTPFRKYSPTVSRWLSTDAEAGSVGNPQTLNLYPYVTDNPTNLADPLGLQPLASGCDGCSSPPPFFCPHAPPPPDYIPNADPFTAKLPGRIFAYFRVCICDQITWVPVGIPKKRQKACAMYCKCDDGTIGIGLYGTRELQQACGEAADLLCPWQIKTVTEVRLIKVFPFEFQSSRIINCRLLESRPWDPED